MQLIGYLDSPFVRRVAVTAELAYSLVQSGRLDDAEQQYALGLATLDAHRPDDHGERVRFLMGQALVASQRRRLDVARSLYDEALELEATHFDSDSIRASDIFGFLSDIDQVEGKHDDAVRRSRRSLEIIRARYDDDHPKLVTAIGDLGGLLMAESERAEGIALMRQAVAISSRIRGPGSIITHIHKTRLAMLLAREGEFETAEGLFLPAIEVFDRHPGWITWKTYARHELALMYQQQGDWAKAAEHFRILVEAQRRPSPGVELSRLLIGRCRALLELGEPAEAALDELFDVGVLRERSEAAKQRERWRQLMTRFGGWGLPRRRRAPAAARRRRRARPRLTRECRPGATTPARRWPPETIMMRPSLLPLALLVTACATTSGPPAGFKTYTVEQFFGTVSVSGLGFSPDGSKILVSSDQTGILNAYAIPIDGGEPIQLTDSKTESIRVAGYFPNDERFLYMADSGGNELDHVYVQHPDGSVHDVTPGDGLKASMAGWAHDDQSFFVATNERDRRFMDVYEVQADGYARALFYQNDGGYFPGPISRDKRYLVLTKINSNADNDLHLFDRQSGETRHLTPHQGDIMFGAADFTPDGKSLYLTTNEGAEFAHLVQLDLDSGATEVVFQPDWDVTSAGLSDSGTRLTVRVNEDARTRVHMFELPGMTEVELPAMPNLSITGTNLSNDETRLALYASSGSSPNNLYVTELGGEPTRLTDTLNEAIDPAHLVDAEVVRFESYDGLEVPGILYRPHTASTANKVPAIVMVHGGPGGQSRVAYRGLYQYLVNHGYAVFAINNRGSSGYGKTFYHLDDRKHGDADLDDCVASKQMLIDTGWVDPDCIGIMGGSYGGYMTLAALTFRPTEFAVGVDLFGISNWHRTVNNIPPWWTAQKDALEQEMGDFTDAAFFKAKSPIFHADKIVRPLMVLAGRQRSARAAGRVGRDRRSSQGERSAGRVRAVRRRGPRVPQEGQPARGISQGPRVPRRSPARQTRVRRVDCPPVHRDPVEDLLIDWLELSTERRKNALDELCVRHPELADELRTRARLLDRLHATGPRDETADERLGEFRLLRQLGGGGMGVVYLARQERPGLERDVALKVVRQGAMVHGRDPRTIRARSARGAAARPPGDLPGPRRRRSRRHPVHRDAARPRRDARAQDRRRPRIGAATRADDDWNERRLSHDIAPEPRANRGLDRDRRPRTPHRARGGAHPPGRQAGQHHGDPGGRPGAAGLRPGSGRRGCEPRSDADQPTHRNPGLHVARASARRRRRPDDRRLFAGDDALRMLDDAAAVPGAHSRSAVPRDPARRTTLGAPPGSVGAEGPVGRRGDRDGQGTGSAVPLGLGVRRGPVPRPPTRADQGAPGRDRSPTRAVGQAQPDRRVVLRGPLRDLGSPRGSDDQPGSRA